MTRPERRCQTPSRKCHKPADGSKSPAQCDFVTEALVSDTDSKRRECRREVKRGDGNVGMSDPWSERAELYRTSAAHAEGPDLDLDRRVGRGLQDGDRRGDRAAGTWRGGCGRPASRS